MLAVEIWCKQNKLKHGKIFTRDNVINVSHGPFKSAREDSLWANHQLYVTKRASAWKSTWIPTMTALSHIQQEWTASTENKMITGILLWDLSAVFDCLDSSILCNKILGLNSFIGYATRLWNQAREGVIIKWPLNRQFHYLVIVIISSQMIISKNIMMTKNNDRQSVINGKPLFNYLLTYLLTYLPTLLPLFDEA